MKSEASKLRRASQAILLAGWIVLVSIVIGATTIYLMRQILFHDILIRGFSGKPIEDYNAEPVVSWMLAVLLPVAFAALVFGAAASTGVYARSRKVLVCSGLAIGIGAAAALMWLVHQISGSTDVWEVVQYCVYGVIGGVPGALLIHRYSERRVAQQRAIEAISCSVSLQGIADALGENVGFGGVRVIGLWASAGASGSTAKEDLISVQGVSSDGKAGLTLLGLWSSRTKGGRYGRASTAIMGEYYRSADGNWISENDLGVLEQLAGESGSLKWIKIPLLRGQGADRWQVGVMSVGVRRWRIPERLSMRWRNVAVSVASEVEHVRHLGTQVRKVSEQVLEGERQARRMDMHDRVGGSLMGVEYDLTMAVGCEEASAVRELLQRALESIREARSEFDKLRTGAPPADLERMQMWEAMDVAARRRLSGSGVQYSIGVESAPDDGDYGGEWHFGGLVYGGKPDMYVAAKEALSNVSKHAGASNVTITLQYLPDAVRLTIADDGCGFDGEDSAEDNVREEHLGRGGPDLSTSGSGLGNIRYRMWRAGGTAAISTAIAQGTEVTLRMPIGESAAGQDGRWHMLNGHNSGSVTGYGCEQGVGG